MEDSRQWNLLTESILQYLTRRLDLISIRLRGGEGQNLVLGLGFCSPVANSTALSIEDISMPTFMNTIFFFSLSCFFALEFRCKLAGNFV